MRHSIIFVAVVAVSGGCRTAPSPPPELPRDVAWNSLAVRSRQGELVRAVETVFISEGAKWFLLLRDRPPPQLAAASGGEDTPPPSGDAAAEEGEAPIRLIAIHDGARTVTTLSEDDGVDPRELDPRSILDRVYGNLGGAIYLGEREVEGRTLYQYHASWKRDREFPMKIDIWIDKETGLPRRLRTALGEAVTDEWYRPIPPAKIPPDIFDVESLGESGRELPERVLEGERTPEDGAGSDSGAAPEGPPGAVDGAA